MDNVMTSKKLDNSQQAIKDIPQQLVGASKFKVLQYVDEIVIGYPLMNTILMKIEECQQSRTYSGQPECLSILGPTRSGKTTIVEHHRKKYPDREEIEGSIKPILYSKVPCPAYIGGLVTQLLHDLGDPFYNRGKNFIEQKLRLYGLLKKCKVQLIILDEVQHLVDRNRNTLIMDSSDFFKNLIDETGLPVVFVGLEESKKIYSGNKQLGSRVLNRFEIGPLAYNDPIFRAILHHMDKSLPFKYYCGLSNQGMWENIHIATNGCLGYLKILIKESVKVAIEKDMQMITMAILASAYESKLKMLSDWSMSITNPFACGFDLDEFLMKNSKNNHKTDTIGGPKTSNRGRKV